MAFTGITKKQGFDFNFYQRVNCTWTTFGAAPGGDGYSPDMIITFPVKSLMVINEDAANVVQISFNGNVLHEEINPSIIRGCVYDDRQISLIWLRVVSGSANVSIRAWGTR